VIALIDYKAGNLTSVRKAFAALGADLFTPERPDELTTADAIVVPGVGHFGATKALGPEWIDAILGIARRLGWRYNPEQTLDMLLRIVERARAHGARVGVAPHSLRAVVPAALRDGRRGATRMTRDGDVVRIARGDLLLVANLARASPRAERRAVHPKRAIAPIAKGRRGIWSGASRSGASSAQRLASGRTIEA